MFWTNIRVYQKFLARNRAYTLINLVGFSAALAFVVLLGLYVAEESRTDRHQEKGDRIFKLLHDGSTSNWPAPAGPAMADRYPEIEAYVRYSDDYMTVDPGGGAEKIRAMAMIVDSTFFHVFTYPLAAGDPSRQLQTAADVTVSEDFAKKVFGAEDPMGKALTIDGDPHTVTGVVRKFPKSHLATPEIMVRFDDTHVGRRYFQSWGSANFGLFVLTREGADPPAKADDMVAWLKEVFWIYQRDLHRQVTFEPLRESYFNPDGWGQYLWRANSRTFLAVLAAAVLAILLFAVINYVNLSVALGGFRAREAAMRRLLGGSRGGLLAGYVTESVVFCAGAFLIALVLASALEPAFNRVMGSSISLAALANPLTIALVAASVVVLGLISGLSPALVITRVKPIDVVKGDFTRRTRMVYSRLFIGLQFCLTVVLIGCALTIGRQTRFMRTTDLGFDKSNLITMDNTLPLANLAGLRDRLMTVPGVEQVSFTCGTPANGGNNTNTYDDGRSISFQTFVADSLFMDILGIDVVSRTGNSADSALWINQTAYRMLEMKPDSLSFTFNTETWGLAGVVRDFHFRSMDRAVDAMVIEVQKPLEDTPWNILVKVAAGNPATTYKAVVDEYLAYNGGEPFESGFLDAEIDSWYDDQRRTGHLIAGFSILAVVISAMGLVAMTTYFMRQRRRDIAVRKVFGATDGEVLGRLVGNFMRIVAVAFVPAVPLIWWLMRRWLSGFAYRVPLSWTIFALAGLSVGAVALAAVWWQSLTAARRNPVEALGNE